MTFVDRLIQRARIAVALKHLQGRLHLIDVGAHEGELFRALGPRLSAGFGVEPLAPALVDEANFVIQPGYFPAVRPTEARAWDAVTLLAVLEHIPPASQTELADACWELLKEGGRVVITVPSPAVDYILNALRALRLIDGMSLEEHYGFDPGDTLRIFAPPRFVLVHRSRFQFGLNNLYVFEKCPG